MVKISEQLRNFIALFISIWLVAPNFSEPAMAKTVRPSTWQSQPWQPQLNVNKDPEVCGEFLSVIRNSFQGDEYWVSFKSLNWEESSGIRFLHEPWGEVEQTRDIASQVEIGPKLHSADTEGTHWEVLQIGVPWQGMNFHLELYKDTNKLLESLPAHPTDNDIREMSNTLNGNGHATFNNSGQSAAKFKSWQALEIGERTLFFKESAVGLTDYLTKTSPFQLYEFDENMTLDPLCSIDFFPIVPRTHHEQRLHQALTRQVNERTTGLDNLTDIVEFVERLDQIMGTAFGWRGTHDVWAYRWGLNETALHQTVYRPWVLEAIETTNLYSNDPPISEKMDFLDVWATRGPWEWQQVEALPEARQRAMEAYANYFQVTFKYGVEKAGRLAGHTVDNLIRTYFSGASIYDPGQTQEVLVERARSVLAEADSISDERKRYQKLSCVGNYINLMLLTGQPWDEVKLLVERWTEIRDTNLGMRSRECWELSHADPFLSYAIFRPDDLPKLVGLGFEVDETNWFGKTPLMHAAHLDQIEAVKTLIELSAQVNRRTHIEFEPPERDPGPAIKHRGRTALMYAAENASADLVKLLLDKGADPNIKDSQGWTALNYLERNDDLTRREKRRLKRKLKPTD